MRSPCAVRSRCRSALPFSAGVGVVKRRGVPRLLDLCLTRSSSRGARRWPSWSRGPTGAELPPFPTRRTQVPASRTCRARSLPRRVDLLRLRHPGGRRPFTHEPSTSRSAVVRGAGQSSAAVFLVRSGAFRGVLEVRFDAPAKAPFAAQLASRGPACAQVAEVAAQAGEHAPSVHWAGSRGNGRLGVSSLSRGGARRGPRRGRAPTARRRGCASRCLELSQRER